ncbi:MAG: beta-lactamase family protein [Chitinophagaceae bacterium]|nr:beta-lactamase family protein [Chitinophagaceae bacterium]
MLIFRVLIFLLFASIASGQPSRYNDHLKNIQSIGIIKQVNSTKEVLHESIHQYLSSLVDTSNFQGVALVVKGNAIIHKAVYGNSNREENKPINFRTQYLLGSLSKSFVSTAIMQMVEAGTLNLFTPIIHFLPELNEDLAKGLNVHLLLKHQSGLATNLDEVTNYPLMELAPKELLALINKIKRRGEPGVKFEISSLNFMLLGLIIERLSGKSYEEYMKENLFNPLQLSSTGISHLFSPAPHKANGYRLVEGKVRRIEDFISYSYATADMYSSVGDLFTWGYALQHGWILSKQSMDLLFDGGVKESGNYGYGFRTQSYMRHDSFVDPGKLIRHGGFMNGFCANYHYYDKDDLTTILLNNYRNLRILDITFKLKELVYGYAIGQRKNTYDE